MNNVIFVCIKNPKGIETITILDENSCNDYKTSTDLKEIKEICSSKIIVSLGYTLKILQSHSIVNFYSFDLKQKFREKYELSADKKISRWDMAEISGCLSETKKYEDPAITKNYNGNATCNVYKIIYEAMSKS
jgi:hypothetical protein